MDGSTISIVVGDSTVGDSTVATCIFNGQHPLFMKPNVDAFNGLDATAKAALRRFCEATIGWIDGGGVERFRPSYDAATRPR